MEKINVVDRRNGKKRDFETFKKKERKEKIEEVDAKEDSNVKRRKRKNEKKRIFDDHVRKKRTIKREFEKIKKYFF
jgi:hypothetical protein